MPIITEPIEEVREYIEDNTPLELTTGDIADVWLVVFIGVLMYFCSNFISVLLKVAGAILVLLGLYTIFLS